MPPMIPVLLAIAMVIEVAGSVCLVTGYQARIAAFAMFWYTTAVTVIFHNYWAASDMMAAMQETHFRKNLALHHLGSIAVLPVHLNHVISLRSINHRAFCFRHSLNSIHFLPANNHDLVEHLCIRFHYNIDLCRLIVVNG